MDVYFCQRASLFASDLTAHTVSFRSFFPQSRRDRQSRRVQGKRDETLLVFARVDNAPGRQPGDVLLPRAPVARTHTYNARNIRHCTQTCTHTHKLTHTHTNANSSRARYAANTARPLNRCNHTPQGHFKEAPPVQVI